VSIGGTPKPARLHAFSHAREKATLKNSNGGKKRYNFQTSETVMLKLSMKRVQNNTERKRGQVMLEYVVALGVFLAMIGLCAALVYAFRSYGGRVLDIIAVS
jgi:hypothetical protein